MSERSEFAGPPADNARSEGTPKGRRGGRVSLLTFLSRDKKVSRPPGRTPGRSRQDRSPKRTNPVQSREIQSNRQRSVQHVSAIPHEAKLTASEFQTMTPAQRAHYLHHPKRQARSANPL